MTTLDGSGDELVGFPIAPMARPGRLRFVAAFAFGLFGILAVGAGAFAAFEASYAGRILPGVAVGAVDLSGLSPAQAAGRLTTGFEALADGEIVLMAPGASRRVAYDDLGRRLDVDGLVAQAMAVGRAGSPIERLATDIRSAIGGHVIAPSATFDETALARAVALLAAEVERQPVDAIVTSVDGAFPLAPAVDGTRVDRATVIAAAAASIRDMGAPALVEIHLPISPVAPAISTASAEAARAAAARVGRAIVLSDGDDRWTIPAATVRSWISFETRDGGAYGPVVDASAIEAALGPIALEVVRAAVDASWIIEGDRVTGVIPSVSGRALDVPATAQAIVRLAEQRRAGVELAGIDLPGSPTSEPTLTTAEAEAMAPNLVAISSWTTWFPYGIRNGNGANIWIPAGDLDGLVLMPGEWFDFWEEIGPVTYERGYREGGAIINGRSEPQGALAGGICSCSTTLFNAALRAGLEMGARRNHYYYINRYPIGLDATVFRSSSGSVQTVSFRNDTEAPILIKSRGWRVGEKGYVQFTFWSLPTGRTVTLSKPVVTNVKPSFETVEYTNDLPYGTKDRVEYAVDGMDVSVTRTVRDASGTVIHTDTYVSHYARMTGITLIGTRGAPAPTPTPTPDSTPAPTPS